MRKKTALSILVIVAFGLGGTILSLSYQKEDSIITPIPPWVTSGPYVVLYAQNQTYILSCGFPLSWYGYWTIETWYNTHWNIPAIPTKHYWFSSGSFLLDSAFWLAISSFVSLSAIKSAQALNLARKRENLVSIARKCILGAATSITLLVISLFFIVIGAGLCFIARPYLDLGLRSIGSGTFVLIATVSVMLWKPSNVKTYVG